MGILFRLGEGLQRAAAHHLDWNAFFWRHRNKRSIEKYWELGTHPSNGYLLDRLGAEPFSSALELGCSCGPRLFAAAQRWPNVNLMGVDINRHGVAFGNRRFQELGLFPRVHLENERIEALQKMQSVSFDVCFTWAALIYVKPVHIISVLSEIVRITRKRIVLLEMHHENAQLDPLGTGSLTAKGNWIRDYSSLLSRYKAQGYSLTLQPMPQEIWNPSGGGATCITLCRP